MFCDGYCSINDHEVPTKVSNTRIKCTNLGWDPERSCHFVYIAEIDRVTQSVSAEWNERSFSSLGPTSKSILQARRDLPKAIRTEAQKAIDEGKAEWVKAGKQAQKELDTIRRGFSPTPHREKGQPAPHTPIVPAYNPNPTRASRSRGKQTVDRAGNDSDPGGTPEESEVGGLRWHHRSRITSKLVRSLSGGPVWCGCVEHVDAVLRSEGPEGDGEVARDQVDVHLLHHREQMARSATPFSWWTCGGHVVW
jgi:hypothetical protein